MQFLAAELKGKFPDVFIVRGLFERSIAEAAKRRIPGEGNAEQTLRTLWMGYIDFLVRERKGSCLRVLLRLMCHHFDQRGQGIDGSDMARTIKRATRSVPDSGEVWARYIRHLVCRNMTLCSVHDLRRHSRNDEQKLTQRMHRWMVVNRSLVLVS
jgi:hypothetical protein